MCRKIMKGARYLREIFEYDYQDLEVWWMMCNNNNKLESYLCKTNFPLFKLRQRMNKMLQVSASARNAV